MSDHEPATIHWSDAKHLALSALHYKSHLATPFATTRPMRVGTCVHRFVLGGTFPTIVSSRRGKAWDDLKREQPDVAREAVTQDEVDDAEVMAAAVLSHPLGREYLVGEHEVPLEWELAGRRFATRGVRHGDLKTVRSVRPERLRANIRDMLYHAQIEWVRQGLEATGHTFTDQPFLLCVEGPPAYDVVVVELTKEDLIDGAKMIHAWMSRLEQAESSGEWTGYSQSPIKLDLPRQIDLSGLDDEDDEAAQ